MAGMLASSSAPASAEWKPTTAPLTTRWAKEVSPDNAHPEYPRPQMVRSRWKSLNGLWQFAPGEEGEEPPLGKELKENILVPYPVESALSGIGRREDRLWYRRTFEVPEEWSGQRVLLHFEAVDWEAQVWVNGKKLGEHKGGYDPFTFDVTGQLNASGLQELIVGVYDPTDKAHQPRGKQVTDPNGIWYTPSSGIWQSVWLEPVPKEASIAGLEMVPDVDSGRLMLRVAAAGEATGTQVRAVASTRSDQVATVTGSVGEELKLDLKDPRLWSPEDPHLYDLRVELLKEGKAVDVVDSYFGMRKVVIGRDDKGIPRILLNGKPVFQIGPLDQGFWPDGLHTAPTDDALRWDIEFTRKLGFNMLRKHIKVEPARFYYWADKLGILVWQDMPSPGTRPLENEQWKKQFEHELKRMLQSRGNSPSIIMWVVWNEAWGQYDTERLTAWVRDMDPSRLVNNASGWHDRNVGDVVDMHRYPGPGSPNPEPERAAVLGEFGGLGLKVEGHMWQQETFHYQATEDKDQLTRRYEQLLRRVHQLKEDPGLSAAVYTQTTDVEGENNGLVTYDREVVKVDVERVARANRGELPPAEVKTIIPTAEREPITWRYTTEKPGKGWAEPGFDDSAWKEGEAGFGREGTPGGKVRTQWTSSGIWIRRTFEMPEVKGPGDLYFLVHHDEEATLYLNGVKAARENGHTTNYVEIPMSAEARATLKPGENVFAVHCKNKEGGQYIDAGIISILEK